MDEVRSRRELLAEEDRAWHELHRLVDSLPEDMVDEPGYFDEGWSAKDLVAHIGNWLAEAGVVLERIRFGTYRPEELDIDAMNQEFHDAMHDVPFAVCGHKASQRATGCSGHGDRSRRTRRRRTDGSASPVPITTRSICPGSGSG